MANDEVKESLEAARKMHLTHTQIDMNLSHKRYRIRNKIFTNIKHTKHKS